MYVLHPSLRLNVLFRQRAYQGAPPHESEFLFVGLDANYAADIDDSNAFESIREYHEDGVAFWRRHEVHHPFMLSTYRGDGRRYHVNFAKIGFASDHAHLVSFVELLHVPTVGRSNLTAEDLDRGHLSKLNSLITSGECRNIFLSPGVIQLMCKTGHFPWLKPSASTAQRPLPILHRIGQTTVRRHLHFSNYGKFEEQMNDERAAIADLVQCKASRQK